MKIDLARKFSKKAFDIIRAAGAVADKKGFCVYIVGGPVRDILLNRPNYDLDFVVEGDGIKFAETLTKTLKAGLKIHRAFGTATISCKNFRIDVVTARKESYESPASYPDVEPGGIKEDLFRRDFTINAMAAAINKKNFGKLVDFCDGFKDLKKGIIRAMHDKSFIDDPTRIFRAVRFSIRFGFKIEPRTKRLMKEAILGGFLGEVNRGRVRKEIELFLKEKNPLKCLETFSNLI
ncbi:CCA tRNA nucleotidyltransferase [Candidatus Omnitrophota bacterium]